VIGGIDLFVEPGSTLALVGPSGCGKSTLLELVAGGLEPTAGRIAVAGEEAPKLRGELCAWMPQSDLLLPWKDAADNAALALRIAGAERREARERAVMELDRLGLTGFAEAMPSELSGGMRQRVAFARTLLAGRPALLLDEPFAALDAITRAELQVDLAAMLREARRTALLVTHDVEEALYVADEVAILTPRPARIMLLLTSPADRAVPRAAAISEPAFVAAREAALEALAGRVVA